MANESELPKYTWEEISKHKDRDSLWLVFENKVYDVTGFIDEVRCVEAIQKLEHL